jgi:hypothetical protein
MVGLATNVYWGVGPEAFWRLVCMGGIPPLLAALWVGSPQVYPFTQIFKGCVCMFS